jgi:glycine/D-amino acid oxidase-like deaminating enzyme
VAAPVDRWTAWQDHARAVIIGGGVGGTSIAYHLASAAGPTSVLVDPGGAHAPARRSIRRLVGSSAAP